MNRRTLIIVTASLVVVAGIGLAIALTSGSNTNQVVSPGETTTTLRTVPTSAPSTTTTTTKRLATPTVPTRPPPSVKIIPPSTAGRATTPTTAPASTTSVSTTTTPPTTTTTTPVQKQEAALQRDLLQRLGSSNRGLPDPVRFAVTYKPRDVVTVTWAIDDGLAPLPAPSGCRTPVSTTTTSGATSTSTTQMPSSTTTTTVDPSQLSTSERARFEAQQILISIKFRLHHGLNITDARLVGTYVANGTEVKVVDITYLKPTIHDRAFSFREAFDTPYPAKTVSCLDPAFATNP